MMNEKNQGWKASIDLDESTAYIQIYTDEDLKSRVKNQAEDYGYSLSRFCSELLYEALLIREEGNLSLTGQSIRKDEQLEAKVQDLEDRLKEKESESANAVSFDPKFIQDNLLTTNYQELEDILRRLVEDGFLDDILRQPLENQLYFLAAQGEVEFETGWGWKRVEQGGGE